MTAKPASIPSIDMEKVLTPAHSVSRAGKMAQSSMHVTALVRSGVAAFQKKSFARRPIEISVAEIVDPQALDVFGTCTSSVDLGRNNELCSSPRGHPELENRLLRLMEEDKHEKFQNSVAVAVPAVKDVVGTVAIENLLKPLAILPPPEQIPAPPSGHSPKATAAHTALPTARSKSMPSRPNTHQTNSLQGTLSGTSSFKTSERFKNRFADVPPVGHYRPKFLAVDGSMKGANIRGRVWNDVSPRREKEESVSATTTNKAVPAPPIKAAAPQPPKTAPTGDELKAIAKAEARKKMSAVFKSVVPSAATRPPPTTLGADQMYDVVDVATKRFTKSMVSLGTMTGRRDTGSRGATSAPDVMYNVKKPSSSVPTFSFQRQISREKAQGVTVTRSGTGGSQQPSTNPLGSPVPHGSELYNTQNLDQLKYKRLGSQVDFGKQTPRRDITATAVQNGANSADLGFLDVNDRSKQNTRQASRSVPTVKLENYTKFPPPKKPITADLVYDVQDTLISPRAQTALIHPSGKGHEDSFNKSLTKLADVMYNPNMNSVRPRQVNALPFSQSLPRDLGTTRGSTSHIQAMDAEYNTDVEALRPRVTGNPSMATHMSRDRRAQILTVKASQADHFYDVKYNFSSPRTALGNVSFSKGVSRDEQVLGHGNPSDSVVGRKVLSSLPGPASYDSGAKDVVLTKAPVMKFPQAKRVT